MKNENDSTLSLKLLRMMQLIRRTEERLIAEYHPADEMRCPIHFCIGQEATPAALSVLLAPTDVLMTHHRCHGYYLAKGAPLDAMVAEFYGRATGSNGGMAGSQELTYAPNRFYSGAILSGSFAIAAGDAFAARYTGDGHITVAVIGDGGMDEGIVYETMNFSALFTLPILFICENNLFSAHTHIDNRAVSRTVAGRAAACGIETAVLDGNDPLATHARLSEMTQSLREGKGPFFAEVMTYRICGHVGPEDDDHLGYRDAEELQQWRQRDPIVRLRDRLISEGISVESLDEDIREIDVWIEGAIRAARLAPMPRMSDALGFNRANSYDPIVTFGASPSGSNLDPAQPETKLGPY